MSSCGVQFRIPDGIVQISERRVIRDGRTTALTPLEADMLRTLLEANGETVDISTLLQTVWNAHPHINTRAPTFTAFRIRSKIELDPSNPTLLLTDYGRGFRLVVSASTEAVDAGVLPASRYRNAFVGRSHLLEQLHRARQQPLVVVTGPPGVGKTRLVDAYLVASTQTFRWFDLENDLDRLPHGLTEVLTQQPQVVVLDGADGPTEALRAWWEEIRHHVRFQLIVTRAASLQATNEWVLEVPPLPADEALELYAKRLEERNLTLDTNQLSPLLRALDHLPLAVELTATRAMRWSPSQQLRLLERGVLPEHHGTGIAPRSTSLSATLQHHLQHLSNEDIEALEWISQFPGGISEEDVVLASTDGPLASVERLYDHHLVRIASDGRISVPRWIRTAVLGTLNAERRADLETQRIAWVAETLRRHPHPTEWYRRETVNLVAILAAGAPDVDLARSVAEFAWARISPDLGLEAANAWFRWTQSDDARLQRLQAYILRFDTTPSAWDVSFEDDRDWFVRQHARLTPTQQTRMWLGMAIWEEFREQHTQAASYLARASESLPENDPELEAQLAWRHCTLAIAALDEEALLRYSAIGWTAAQKCTGHVRRLNERRRATALVQAGRADEAEALLRSLRDASDPFSQLAAIEADLLLESDRLDEAIAFIRQHFRESEGLSYRLRYHLFTGDYPSVQALLDRGTPESATLRRYATVARAALLRENGDPQGAVHLLLRETPTRQFTPSRRVDLCEQLLALQMAGDPRADQLYEELQDRVFPWEREVWRTLRTDDPPPHRLLNLFYSKRWVDAKKLFAPKK